MEDDNLLERVDEKVRGVKDKMTDPTSRMELDYALMLLSGYRDSFQPRDKATPEQIEILKRFQVWVIDNYRVLCYKMIPKEPFEQLVAWIGEFNKAGMLDLAMCIQHVIMKYNNYHGASADIRDLWDRFGKIAHKRLGFDVMILPVLPSDNPK